MKGFWREDLMNKERKKRSILLSGKDKEKGATTREGHGGEERHRLPVKDNACGETG